MPDLPAFTRCDIEVIESLHPSLRNASQDQMLDSQAFNGNCGNSHENLDRKHRPRSVHSCPLQQLGCRSRYLRPPRSCLGSITFPRSRSTNLSRMLVLLCCTRTPMSRQWSASVRLVERCTTARTQLWEQFVTTTLRGTMTGMPRLVVLLCGVLRL